VREGDRKKNPLKGNLQITSQWAVKT